MRYLLALLLLVLTGCATINFESIQLDCAKLPSWAVITLIASAIFGSGGFLISEWMSLTSRVKSKGVVQGSLALAVVLIGWLKAKLGKSPPKPDA